MLSVSLIWAGLARGFCLSLKIRPVQLRMGGRVQCSWLTTQSFTDFCKDLLDLFTPPSVIILAATQVFAFFMAAKDYCVPTLGLCSPSPAFLPYFSSSQSKALNSVMPKACSTQQLLFGSRRIPIRARREGGGQSITRMQTPQCLGEK